MAIIFFNIGWMKSYNGMDDDSISNGGSYNESNVGAEIHNFHNYEGNYYGFVQAGSNQIRIERIGAGINDDSISGVTVIWTATAPQGGTVIVGWYKDATVYRFYQKLNSEEKDQLENESGSYIVKAKVENGFLLSESQRNFLIPRAQKGGIGQSNVWYADKPESQSIVRDIVHYLNSPDFLVDLDSKDELLQAYKEGNPRLVKHLVYERSSAVIELKKSSVLQSGKRLACEVCGFDFEKKYGPHGAGFCEVHHLKPLSKMDGASMTSVDDLAILCSNCHRMVHRRESLLTPEQLKKMIEAGGGESLDH